MRPKTISASSLNTADSCLARYKAENIEYTPSGSDKTAANIGTACHGALEEYVREVHINKTSERSFDLLKAHYEVSFKKTFDTVECKGASYDDGLAMLQTWFVRTDLSSVTVLSVEEKIRFPIPTSVGDIPMTYIVDRVDVFEEDGKKIVRVVDYKTIRAFLSHEEVREKLQARIYHLMMRIQFKGQGIDEFQVQFDLLRHDQVGVVYTAEDAEDTWYAIIARAERILATPDDNPPETLNSECPYCVRKLQCKALRKNISGGGMFSVDTIESVAKLRDQLAGQEKGIKSALGELDTFVMAYAKEHDLVRFNTDNGYGVAVTGRNTRVVDAGIAAGILGPELMKRFGKLNVGDVDKIIAMGVLDEQEEKDLLASVGTKVGNVSVKVTKKK